MKKRYKKNVPKCQAYKKAGTREKNKLRKLKKYCKNNPNDFQAKNSLSKISTTT